MDDHTKFVLNIKTPEQMASQQFSDTKKIVPDMKNIYSISKLKVKNTAFLRLAETLYLRMVTGLWELRLMLKPQILLSLKIQQVFLQKYEKKYFSLSSKYKKNNMTVTQIQTDNFSVIPELKFNDIFAIQDVLSTDITRNRRSSRASSID